MGRITPEGFAGGRVSLAPDRAEAAVVGELGAPLGLARDETAYAISEMVDETMANAARVHAIEWGKDVARRAMIAFGGAAPLHAARLAEKLEIEHIVIPTGAGVGSAIGFLTAPVAFEVVRSRYLKLSDYDPAFVAAAFAEMRAEAEAIVRAGAGEGRLVERRTAAMRYGGQGHEIVVELDESVLSDGGGDALKSIFEAAYRRHFTLTIPGVDIEVLSWTLTLSSLPPPIDSIAAISPAAEPASPIGERAVFFPGQAEVLTSAVYRRQDLKPGMAAAGPALVVEDQTTTVVPPGFNLQTDARGYLHLTRRSPRETLS